MPCVAVASRVCCDGCTNSGGCPRLATRYLLRSNLQNDSPESVWEKYVLLARVEQAFKDLKADLSIRPVYHQRDRRIEAHIFVSFLSYCLFVTLGNLLKPSAAGLTPRSVLEKLSAVQMVDVHLPTTDGQTILLQRYTQPEPEAQLLLKLLNLRLPEQQQPRIYSTAPAAV